ncbi:MAG TPA: glycosyltransferase family 1 protein [Casimicrobiaceae bacterium]
MRVGIDGTCWWNQRGFGRFTRELLPALLKADAEHEFTLFFDGPVPPEIAALDVSIVQVAARAPVVEAAVAGGRRRLADIAACSRATAAHRLDVFFFPAVYSWYPLRPGQKSVVGVHDAIAEKFPELVFPERRGRRFWALKVRAALWQATRVLTVSQASKQDIVRYLKVAPERIDLTTEAANARFRPVGDAAAIEAVRRRVGLPPGARFLLYVGGLAPHKNLLLLQQGFAQAVARSGADGLYLVIAGDPAGAGFNSCADELHRHAREHPVLRERVLFPGFVPEPDLPCLYSAALAVVMPALTEGFGLPAIEAIACGVPVLASSTGAVPEVLGDAGLLFDPRSAASLATEISRIASDAALLDSLRRKALARSFQFSWTRAAALALASLERAANGA